MKFINFLLIIFITINSPIKADLNQNLINELKQEGKLIFIRHAYAPGGGDPINFDINECNTQRNLNNSGRNQADKIGSLFKDNNISTDKVYSSEWCRCKETALIAFNQFETKNFLNSFFSSRFAQNKNSQIKSFKKFIKSWDGKKNLIFVTHYVFISEILDYAPSSGEIIISDKDLKVIDTIEIEY
ncbi:histidine phosphatase family protein [Candidatus Pelagibacter bacterium nBUS_28]|uniref:histidine phosphatase family protein n=1 Tax=Candidatus Pelagibacter bacterium nBUS_28 TaxID=3374189 RepID=UPI003EBA924D